MENKTEERSWKFDLSRMVNDLIKDASAGLVRKVEGLIEASTGFDEVATVLSDFGTYMKDLKEGVIYGPYSSLSTDSSSYVRRNIKNPLIVHYSGPYSSLAQVVKKDRHDKEIASARYAKALGISTVTLFSLERDTLSKEDPQYFSPKRKSALNDVRKRIIKLIEVDPKDYQHEVESLPLYTGWPSVLRT